MRTWRRICSVLALAAAGWLACPSVHALRPIDAWPLKDDDGDMVSEHDDRGVVLYVDDVGEYPPDPHDDDTLRAILAGLGPTSNVTIVLKKRGLGIPYALRDHWIEIGKSQGVAHVTLRGETDQPQDTVIDATGLKHLFEFYNVADFRLAYITLRNAKEALIRIHGEASATVAQFQFYRCDLFPGTSGDSEGRGGAIYATGDPAETGGTGHVTQNCRVEHCHIGFPTKNDLPIDGCAHGILVEGGVGWVIRHNLFFWIAPRDKPDRGGYSAGLETRMNWAIKFWNQAKDTEIYGNTFNFCEAPITLGSLSESYTHPQRHSHFRGLVKNNGFYRYRKLATRYCNPPVTILGIVADYPFVACIDAADEVKIVHNSGSFYDGGLSPWALFDREGTNGYICKNNLMNSIIEEIGGADAGADIPNVESLNATGYDQPGFGPDDNGLGFHTAPPNDGHVGWWTPGDAWVGWLHDYWEFDPIGFCPGPGPTWGTLGSPMYGQYSHSEMMPDFHINRNDETEENVIDEVERLDYSSDDWDTGLRRRFVDELGELSRESADFGCDEWNVGRPAFQAGGGGRDKGPKPRLPYKGPGKRGAPREDQRQAWRDYIKSRKEELEEKERAPHEEDEEEDWRQGILDGRKGGGGRADPDGGGSQGGGLPGTGRGGGKRGEPRQ